MSAHGMSTVIDLGNDGVVDASASHGLTNGGAGGHQHGGDCCGGQSHGEQKKISLDVMEEGKEVEFLFEAVKQG